jgi:hypothetical protein
MMLCPLEAFDIEEGARRHFEVVLARVRAALDDTAEAYLDGVDEIVLAREDVSVLVSALRRQADTFVGEGVDGGPC